jgi:hypothetical protein
MIRNETLTDWPEKVAGIYDKHFEKQSAKPQTEGGSAPVSKEDGDLLSPGKNEEELNIKDELIRQNNWMNSKLKSIQDKN